MIEVRRYSCYDRVCQIEKQIFGTSSFVKRDIDDGEREHIKELLIERKDLLNASCPDTAENQKLFWEVTQRLVLLNEQNHIKAKRIVEKLLQSPIYTSETDWCIQAGIELGRNGMGTILKDETYYGSLFYRTHTFLSQPQRYLNQRFSSEDFVVGAREYWRSFCLKDPKLSDWNQFDSSTHIRNWLTDTAHFCQWLSDQNLSIPWIVHEALDLRYWSVPDYLRLSNSLKGTVKLVVQHYVDGYGNKIVEI